MNASDKARLTEEEKKKNHIDSEKKRRNAIRDEYDKLSALVPGMKGQGKSEALMLQATVKHLEGQLAEKEMLKALVLGKGISEAEFEPLASN
ncbi:Transcription factor [Elasticomyces elasticus]|nr:Transcription factor [Elasticomyces elasticus]